MKTLKICVTVLHALFVCRSLFANELCEVTALRFPPLSQTPSYAFKVLPCQILSGLPHHNSR